jgi:hypothetical protein
VAKFVDGGWLSCGVKTAKVFVPLVGKDCHDESPLSHVDADAVPPPSREVAMMPLVMSLAEWV